MEERRTVDKKRTFRQSQSILHALHRIKWIKTKVKWGKCEREIGISRRILPVVNIPKFHVLSGGMCPISTHPIFLEVIDESA